jgi:hypothetical protein
MSFLPSQRGVAHSEVAFAHVSLHIQSLETGRFRRPITPTPGTTSSPFSSALCRNKACTFSVHLDLQPLLAVRYRLLPVGERRILSGHPPAECALQFCAEGEFADFFALVAAHDIALLVEAGVLHAIEAGAPRLDVGGFGVGAAGERAATAGRDLLGVHVRGRGLGRGAGGRGRVCGRERGLERGCAGVGAEAGALCWERSVNGVWRERGGVVAGGL